MEMFYIDSHGGIKAFIYVEKGIIKSIDSGLNPKISKLYVGNSISFLKKDFENRMKPAWFMVKNHRLSTALNNVNVLNYKKGNLLEFKRSILEVQKYSKKLSEELLTKEFDVINAKMDIAVNELNKIKLELETEHCFIN